MSYNATLHKTCPITPAPWTATPPANISGTFVSVVKDSEGNTLFQTRHDSNTTSREQCEADAKLAASSPLLAEALVNVLDMLGALSSGHELKRGYGMSDAEVDSIYVALKASGVKWY